MTWILIPISSIEFSMMRLPNIYGSLILGAIQVIRNADGGGRVSDFLEKSITKV